MTDHAYTVSRVTKWLRDTETTEQLRVFWNNLGMGMKLDPDIQEAKEQWKATLSEKGK